MTSLSTRRLAELSGCGYRQLDYWARIGLLEPSVQTATGSGSQRRYSPDDLRLARMLAALTCGQRGGDNGSQPARRVRRLLSAAFRSDPSARFYVVADGVTAAACQTAADVVALTNVHAVCVVFQPDDPTL